MLAEEEICPFLYKFCGLRSYVNITGESNNAIYRDKMFIQVQTLTAGKTVLSQEPYFSTTNSRTVCQITDVNYNRWVLKLFISASYVWVYRCQLYNEWGQI